MCSDGINEEVMHYLGGPKRDCQVRIIRLKCGIESEKEFSVKTGRKDILCRTTCAASWRLRIECSFY
jgi:hypothetical protein